MQRKNYDLRSGQPTFSGSDRRRRPKILIRPCSPKRRSLNTIINSGAYAREKFVPDHPKVDREAAKQQLQDLMAYGRELKASPRELKKKEKIKQKRDEEDKGSNRFDQRE